MAPAAQSSEFRRAMAEFGPAAAEGRGVYRAEGAWWLPSHLLPPKLPTKLPSDAESAAAAKASAGSNLLTTAAPSPRDTALSRASTARGDQGGASSHRRLAAKCRTNLRVDYPDKWCSDLPVAQCL